MINKEYKPTQPELEALFAYQAAYTGKTEMTKEIEDNYNYYTELATVRLYLKIAARRKARKVKRSI